MDLFNNSNGYYKNLFDKTAAVMLIVDPSTLQILDANPAASSFYGWSHAELVAKKISDINTLDTSELTKDVSSVASEQKSYFIFKHRLADGTTRDVEVYSSPIDTEHGRILHSIVHDITSRHSVEDALKLSEEKYRLIAENTSDGIITFGSDNQVTYVSPSYLKLFGYEEKEELSRTTDSIKSLIHPDDREKVFSDIFKAISDKKTNLEYIYRVKTKDGKYIWREDHAHFKYDQSGEYLGSYVVCRNIDVSKKSEEMLKEKMKELQKTMDFMVGRELKMVELKDEISRLKAELVKTGK